MKSLLNPLNFNFAFSNYIYVHWSPHVPRPPGDKSRGSGSFCPCPNKGKMSKTLFRERNRVSSFKRFSATLSPYSFNPFRDFTEFRPSAFHPPFSRPEGSYFFASGSRESLLRETTFGRVRLYRTVLQIVNKQLN